MPDNGHFELSGAGGQAGLAQSTSLFIRRWGEMGATWGISRTMAEIHALLYIASEPLCTDDVMAELQVSRGSASMNLRQLTDWGLISKVHLRKDRKEYYVAETDVWRIFETITRERRRRELQPVVDTISQCTKMVAEGVVEDSEQVEIYRQRLASMQAFLGDMHDLLNLVLKLKNSGLGRLLRSMKPLVKG